MQPIDAWSYRDESAPGSDSTSGKNLSGFHVQALDGPIGTVDESTNDSDHNYIIVDTGPWIFGKKVMLPAGVIIKIDEHDERIWVDRSKDEIKAAPECGWRNSLGSYYGGVGQGFRDRQ